MAKGQDFCRFLMSAYHLGTVDSIISSHRRDCRMNACSWAVMRQLRTANKAGSPLMESGTLSIRDVPVIRGGGVALLGSHMFP